ALEQTAEPLGAAAEEIAVAERRVFEARLQVVVKRGDRGGRHHVRHDAIAVPAQFLGPVPCGVVLGTQRGRRHGCLFDPAARAMFIWKAAIDMAPITNSSKSAMRLAAPTRCATSSNRLIGTPSKANPRATPHAVHKLPHA